MLAARSEVRHPRVRDAAVLYANAAKLDILFGVGNFPQSIVVNKHAFVDKKIHEIAMLFGNGSHSCRSNKYTTVSREEVEIVHVVETGC
mmetsp:Transcript_6332/g.8850  ORF Transcript_6332/g.8850 Transcript_6332/m.8850 type:complete len:89 (+) Transcript_6332:126-392(+)